MYSSDSNNNGLFFKVPEAAPNVVADQIDAGAKKLEPPSIVDIDLARVNKKEAGATTQWKTPYNRPSYQSNEHIGYTKSALQYIQQGRFVEAEGLLLKAHKMICALIPGDIDAKLKSIENLAWLYLSTQKYDAAEPYVRELITYRIREFEPANTLVTVAVDQLANIYVKTDRHKDASCLYKFLLAMQVDRYGRNNKEICPTLKKLASIYLSRGNYIAAEDLLLRMLYILVPVYGRSSLEISSLLEQLAEVYKLQNRFDKAAEMLERLLHVLESIHGTEAIAVASCLLKLADLLSQVNMHQEAEPLYRRVISIYEVSFGKKTAEISVNRRKRETLSNLPAISPKEKPLGKVKRSRSQIKALDTIREIDRQVKEHNFHPEKDLGVIRSA